MEWLARRASPPSAVSRGVIVEAPLVAEHGSARAEIVTSDCASCLLLVEWEAGNLHVFRSTNALLLVKCEVGIPRGCALRAHPRGINTPFQLSQSSSALLHGK